MPAISFASSNGKNIRLSESARKTHCHCLGLSGSGKSKFLEGLARRDIIAGHSVCVIDPHSDLFDNLVRWIASERIDRIRTVHLLNPSDETYTFGFNPLVMDNGTRLEYRVDAMVDACVKVWGGEDLKQTPRLSKCLSAVFHALAANRLSLAEASFLTNTRFRHVAWELVGKIKNPEYKNLWQEFLTAYNERTFAEYFESTTSRLLPFVGNPVVRDIVGQTDNLINFRECMDKGHVVLVNLRPSGAFGGKTAQLLGALLTNDLYTTAFTRDQATAERRPCYCYIDECARYLTEDVVNCLDETRKMGLHMVLSHQRLEQLKVYGDNFYNAVMANAQMKVMFRAGDEETADVMSRHFFRQSFDLELPKHSMDKPVTVGHEVVWFESRSTTKSHIKGSARSESSGSSSGLTHSEIFDSHGNIVGGHTEGNTSGHSNGTAFGQFSTTSSSQSDGYTEGLKPVIEFLPTELYRLDELIHLGMVELLKLPKRAAYVCGPDLAPFRIETHEVKPGFLLPQFLPRRVARLNQNSPAVSLRRQVQEQIARRAFELEHFDDEPVGKAEDGLF
ncbi:type IV secretion system DNA-binding domain-containing protein [Nitratireductor sp. XY-223]|uniref:type IV secretory system conjugative DNA transfer family protein n=1 Tax=Nitratireductor sp. XY-223 TaxID=2561926 RepID=UPI0010A99757|nr:type IV secretion system DNA-binding domain-containing protein [Nitratireductor sp. XY-223]